MARHVCKSCGSTRTRLVNHGFGAGFLALWAVALLLASGGGVLGTVAVFLALANTVLALFRWKRECVLCKSDDVIPAASPVGRRLSADLK